MHINEIDWKTISLKLNTPIQYLCKDSSAGSFPKNETGVSIADIEFNGNWIGFLGDIHGNVAALKTAVEACREAGITHLFQVGDFGYMFDGSYGLSSVRDKQMDEILKQAKADFDFTLHVIDGNHDNHQLWHRHAKKPDLESRPINDSAQWLYHPRGSVIALDLPGGFDSQGIEYSARTVKIGFMGGARSINVPPSEEELREGIDFWYDEEPTDENLGHLIQGVKNIGGINILVAHDAPVTYHLKKTLRISYTMEELSATTRNILEYAVLNTEPDLFVHGHWHQQASSWYRNTKLLGLHMEHQYGNLAFVNTDDMKTLIPEVWCDLEEKRFNGMKLRIL